LARKYGDADYEGARSILQTGESGYIVAAGKDFLSIVVIVITITVLTVAVVVVMMRFMIKIYGYLNSLLMAIYCGKRHIVEEAQKKLMTFNRQVTADI